MVQKILGAILRQRNRYGDKWLTIDRVDIDDDVYEAGSLDGIENRCKTRCLLVLLRDREIEADESEIQFHLA